MGYAGVQNRCFSRDELKDYALGRSGEQASALIEVHLNQCMVCEDTIVALDNSEDTFVHELKNVSIPEQSEPDSQMERLWENAKHLVNEPQVLGTRHFSLNGHDKIGEYQLCELIGRGGMGQVYRARHVRLDKEFALKILPGSRFSNHESIGRFQREMKMVGKLDHPAIVQATDAGEFEDVHYLTMEFVSGLNVAKVLHYCDPLRICDACEMVRQAAAGIHHAHQQNIIHRDIKPSNLMLSENGRIKILDLGLATLSNLNHSVDELTTVGQMMGTLDYMAPEQCDADSVDHRCDVYALGSTLYKLLTNRTPFSTDQSQSPLQKLKAIAIEDFTPINQHRDDLPAELVDLIHHCLARDPAERIQSAKEVSDRLAAFCTEQNLVRLLDVARDEETNSQAAQNHADDLLALPKLVPSTNRSAMAHPAAAPRRPNRRRGWIALLTMLALLPLALWSIQIIVNWDKGQLVIESETANVHVKLIKDGEPYKEMSLQQGANSTKIRAGRYEILIDDPSDRLVVSNNVFELRRGDTTVAKITSRTDDDVAKDEQQSLPVVTDGPTYEGKTLQQWVSEPFSANSFRAVKALSSEIDSQSAKNAVEQLTKRIEIDVSRKQNFEAFLVACEICPDEQTAVSLLEALESIVKRFSPSDILDSNSAYATTFGSGVPVYLNQLVESLAGYQSLAHEHAKKCLSSSHESLRAYGCMRLWRTASSNPEWDDREAIVERMIQLAQSKDKETQTTAMKTLALRFATDKSIDFLASVYKTEPAETKSSIIPALAKHRPQLSGLAKETLELYEAVYDDGVRNKLGSAIVMLANAGNKELAIELDRRFSDPKWGWNVIPSSKIASRSDVQNDGWQGEYDYGQFNTNIDEGTRVKLSVRYRLLEDIKKANSDSSEMLIPILKKQLNQKYSEYYLNLVLNTIGALDPDSKFSAINFWFDVFISTEEEIDKARAANFLRSRISSSKFGEETGEETLVQIVVRMREINCETPDQEEAKTIAEIVNFVKTNMRVRTLTSFISRILSQLKQEDAAFLLRLLETDRGLPIRSNMSDSPQALFSFMASLESPILKLRAIDLKLVDEVETWNELLASDMDEDIRVLVHQYLPHWLFELTRGSLEKAANIKHELQIDPTLFQTSNPDELKSLLVATRYIDLTPLNPESMSSAETAFQSNNARLVYFLIDKLDLLKQKAKYYEPDIWNLNSKGTVISELPILVGFVEAIYGETFAEENFHGQKVEIVKNLKELIPILENTSSRMRAEQLLRAIEESKLSYARVQAEAVKSATREYIRDVGSFPEEAKDLRVRTEGPNRDKWRGPYSSIEGIENDPWGKQFKIVASKESQNPIHVISAGPDGEFDTKDDIKHVN
jgi:serine/threonine protein kinase